MGTLSPTLTMKHSTSIRLHFKNCKLISILGYKKKQCVCVLHTCVNFIFSCIKIIRFSPYLTI